MQSGDGARSEQLMEGIAKVDLRGLEPGTPGWAAARAAVTASMAAHGCVVVVAAQDALGPELRRALFGRALPELFALPFDAKQRSGAGFSNGPHRGYVGQVPDEALETVAVHDAAAEHSAIRDFADRLWPQGNPEFCDMMESFAKSVLELEQTLERMTLEGLRAGEESIASQLGSQSHVLRLTLYAAAPRDEEDTAGISLQPHRDEHMTTVIAQHEVGGLEVQATDGRWLAVPPEPDTLVFLAGDQFTVVTNGTVPACVHRVRTPGGGRERFSVLFCRRREGEGAVLRAMDELVDEDHPLMYHPCAHEEYTAFRYSEAGRRSPNPLKAFCAVEKDGSMEME